MDENLENGINTTKSIHVTFTLNKKPSLNGKILQHTSKQKVHMTKTIFTKKSRRFHMTLENKYLIYKSIIKTVLILWI